MDDAGKATTNWSAEESVWILKKGIEENLFGSKVSFLSMSLLLKSNLSSLSFTSHRFKVKNNLGQVTPTQRKGKFSKMASDFKVKFPHLNRDADSICTRIESVGKKFREWNDGDMKSVGLKLEAMKPTDPWLVCQQHWLHFVLTAQEFPHLPNTGKRNSLSTWSCAIKLRLHRTAARRHQTKRERVPDQPPRRPCMT
jgi:hypothetical protein